MPPRTRRTHPLRRSAWTKIDALVAAFVLASVSLAPAASARAEAPAAQQPAFRVDVPNPTADKPQSKLWFAHDSWWAWLPSREGSGVWRRTADGWRRQQSLDAALRGLPGRADVWSDGATVRAVLVKDQSLAIVTLRYSEDAEGYSVVGSPIRFETSGGGKSDVIETATIARDGRGCWWIAYPWQRRMWIRATQQEDGVQWTKPIAVSDETADDDLCAAVKLPGGVGLAWSNQANDTMNFRLHLDGADANEWQPLEEIERGHRNADDHINAKVTSEGAVILATKNSVDRVGEPQLVLRVRHRNGRWENLPYARKEATGEPSRPLLLLGGDPPGLLLFHTLYGRASDSRPQRRNTIAWQSAPLANVNAATLSAAPRTLLEPDAPVNNVTGCKAPLPAGAPWIVLASDASGNIYEGRFDATNPGAAAAP